MMTMVTMLIFLNLDFLFFTNFKYDIIKPTIKEKPIIPNLYNNKRKLPKLEELQKWQNIKESIPC